MDALTSASPYAALPGPAPGGASLQTVAPASNAPAALPPGAAANGASMPGPTVAPMANNPVTQAVLSALPPGVQFGPDGRLILPPAGAPPAQNAQAAYGQLQPGPDGQPMLAPNGQLPTGPGGQAAPSLDAQSVAGLTGQVVMGPNGPIVVGPDGQPILGPDGQPFRMRAPFSLGRALGNFFKGFALEGVDLIKGFVTNPLPAIGSAVLIAGASALLPALGLVSAASMGAFITVAMGGIALIGLTRGIDDAVMDHLHGDNAKAEQDFEEIGRGSFDFALAVGPYVASKYLNRGQAVVGKGGRGAGKSGRTPRPHRGPGGTHPTKPPVKPTPDPVKPPAPDPDAPPAPSKPSGPVKPIRVHQHVHHVHPEPTPDPVKPAPRPDKPVSHPTRPVSHPTRPTPAKPEPTPVKPPHPHHSGGHGGSVKPTHGPSDPVKPTPEPAPPSGKVVATAVPSTPKGVIGWAEKMVKALSRRGHQIAIDGEDGKGVGNLDLGSQFQDAANTMHDNILGPARSIVARLDAGKLTSTQASQALAELLKQPGNQVALSYVQRLNR